MKYVRDSTKIGRIPDRVTADGRVLVSMQKSTGTPREYSQASTEGVSDHFPVIFEIIVELE